MIRGVGLTLGTVVVLASLNGARADDTTLPAWPPLWPSPPSLTELFPRPPENWADLPVQFHLSQQVGYNSNITNTPTGAGASVATYGRPIGAMQSISTYGVSFKNEIGAHQFFADASAGMYRYLNNDRYNSAHSSVDLGDNFTYGSKCNGSVKLSEVSAPSQAGQQLGFNTVNTLTSLTAAENLKCVITGPYAWLFNSGANSSNNSSFLDKANNYQSTFVAAGISYTNPDANTIQVLATVTGTDYTDRGALLNATGLTNKFTTDQLVATLTRTMGTVSLNASLGVTGIADSYFSFGAPRTILPQYAVSLQWAVTPKLGLTVGASRTIASSTSVLSNLQVTESATTALTYQVTPKATFTAGLSGSYNSGVATPLVTQGVYGVFTSSQRSYSANAAMNYVLTPFLTANLSYQYTKTVQANLTTTDGLILLALNFNPY